MNFQQWFRMRCVVVLFYILLFPITDLVLSFWPKKGLWDPERVITVAAELFRQVKQDSYLLCGTACRLWFPLCPWLKPSPCGAAGLRVKSVAKNRSGAGVLKASIREATPSLKFRISKGRASPFRSHAPYLLLLALWSNLLPGDLEIILVSLVSPPACVLGIFALHVCGQTTGSWFNEQRDMTACNKIQ